MTIEQLWDKYKDRKHLIGTLPKSAYVRIMLYGLALQEEMEKALAELGSAAVRKMPRKAPARHQDEKKANGPGLATLRPKIAALGAFSARKAS